MTTTNVKRQLIRLHWFDFKIAKHKTRPFAFFGVRNFIDLILGEVSHFKSSLTLSMHSFRHFSPRMHKNRVTAIWICIGVALSISPCLSQGKELPRDAHERQAFEEGCDKNQSNMNTCSYYDYKVLDAELNELYKQQQSHLRGTPYAKRLANAQKAWLKYVEADCMYQNGPPEESGTIWPLKQNSCRSAHFTQRIELLKSFLRCTQNGCPGQ